MNCREVGSTLGNCKDMSGNATRKLAAVVDMNMATIAMAECSYVKSAGQGRVDKGRIRKARGHQFSCQNKSRRYGTRFRPYHDCR